jgi:hypothetical protein
MRGQGAFAPTLASHGSVGMSKKILVASFNEAPPIGTRVEYDGQPFTVTRVIPHKRIDNSPSAVLTWEAKCQDCDKRFTVQTGLRVYLKRRRCDEHKWKMGERGQARGLSLTRSPATIGRE